MNPAPLAKACDELVQECHAIVPLGAGVKALICAGLVVVGLGTWFLVALLVDKNVARHATHVFWRSKTCGWCLDAAANERLDQEFTEVGPSGGRARLARSISGEEDRLG